MDAVLSSLFWRVYPGIRDTTFGWTVANCRGSDYFVWGVTLSRPLVTTGSLAIARLLAISVGCTRHLTRL